jgi:hypothetical protein
VQIRSPFALIAVRGTQFFARPSNGRFGVFVARGSVAVTSAGQQVIVREGEGTDFVSSGSPPTPVKRAERARPLASILKKHGPAKEVALVVANKPVRHDRTAVSRCVGCAEHCSSACRLRREPRR